MPLVDIVNDNSTGSGTGLRIQQDQATGPAIELVGNGWIEFPATETNSTNPNTLDDYEEGAWTPGLWDQTNNVTLSTAVGSYTKVGSTVRINCYVVASSLASASGALYITGLPFASGSTSGNLQAITCGYANGLAITAGNNLSGYVPTSDNEIWLWIWDVTTGVTGFTTTELTADGEFMLAGEYTNN